MSPAEVFVHHFEGGMAAADGRYYPNQCRVCGRTRTAPMHRLDHRMDEMLTDGDMTMCPGCSLIVPIEMSVRMYRFVDRDGTTHTNTRVCQADAYLLPWPVMLAVLHDRGLLDEDKYATMLEAL